MEQRYMSLTQNYSRKEGGEMFSLTMSREIEVESTHTRQRIESYVLFYDVEIQILEEILAFEYVTVDFLKGRQKAIANNVNALLNKLYVEMESGKLTALQIGLNEETIDRAYERLVNFLPARREINAVAKVEAVEEREVPVEIVVATLPFNPKTNPVSVTKLVNVEEKIEKEFVSSEPVSENPVVETAESISDLSDEFLL